MRFDNKPLSMDVINFILFSSDKKVNDMYQRSFKLTGNSTIFNTIGEILDNNGYISQNEIVKKCNNIVNLEETTNGLVTVANGWNEKRLSFVLTVEVVYSSSNKHIYFINGYTDFYDPILGRDISNMSVRLLDKTMEFNINTITLITETMDSGGRPIIKFKDKVTILRKYGQAYDYDSIGEECLIRPSDIMSDIYLGTSSGGEYDSDPKETNRSNSNSVSYLASILNTIGDSVRISNSTSRAKDADMARQDIVKEMVTNAEDKKMMKCPFLLHLFKRTGEAKPSRFRIDDILDMATYLDEVTKVFNLTDREENRRNILSSNDLDNTLQPKIGNILALEFYQILSSLLFDQMLTRATIHISNHPRFIMAGEIANCLYSESMFHNVFNSPTAVETLDSFLRRIILPKITKDDQIYVDLMADINILGTSSVAITVNDDDPMIFRYNSSMDNMFSPLISTQQNKNVLTDDISTIIDNVL